MRKIIFITIILISIDSFGHTKKGDKLIGGFVSFYNNSNLDHYVFKIKPNYGKFINEDFCVGAYIPLVYTTDQDYYVGIKPFVRYYFGKNDKTRFFSEFDIQLVKLSDNLISNYYSIGIGHVTFLNKNVGLEALLNYSDGNVSGGLGFFIGFQIYI
jgi:hypothetical protein